MLILYLRSGERRNVPRATAASIIGDRLVCTAKDGKPVALFAASEVYLASKVAISTIPN
jgi:hypothetical protein